jgi:hypothetical protein
MELISINANSETGFSNPEYSNTLPEELASLGMTGEVWQDFIHKANKSVKFQWGLGSICCFFCNAHNKSIAKNMEKFCEDIMSGTSTLPTGVQLNYKMTTEKIIVKTSVADAAGNGATLETYHELIFTKVN